MLRRIYLTLVSAVLAVLVFEPFGWWPLALVAWIPFLMALRGATERLAFYLGLFHGMVLFGGTLSWMWNIFGRGSIALWAIEGLFTAITALLIVKLPEKAALRTAALVGMLWAGVEYFRAEVFELTFPWITPGTGLPPNWLTPVVGVYGVTFLVIWGGALAVGRNRRGLAMLCVMGVMTALFPKGQEAGDPIRVALVQNEDEGPSVLAEAARPFLAEVDAVVWPEYSLGQIDELSLEEELEMGADGRVFVASGLETRDGVTGNTAITVSEDGVIGRHIKNHPVHFFSDGVAGTTAGVVRTPFGKMGTPICFDCDHQDVIRKMTGKGAKFFLIPSLDAAHWSARQHEQHGMLFRHRAAENGRWLAVASSSGVTQIVDSRGQVRRRLSLMGEGVLVGEISALGQRTLFQMGGWWTGPISMFGTGLVILWLVWRRFTK